MKRYSMPAWAPNGAGVTARRNAGNAVIAADEFELAEEIEQADAPGDGAERQIVSGQPYRNDAEDHGGEAGNDKRGRQGQPGRDAVGRGEHRRCIAAKTAEG